MKTFNTLIAVTTFALSASAFALPSQQQDRFFTQAGDYQQPVAADGADRTPGGQTLAADGADRTPGGQALAADGADRTPGGQTLAADGADRTPGGQTLAADGADRTMTRRLA
ncbi:hypothetical protein [Pseudomonas thivervalensis]|uniref:hypothetical protein n=1 Tax=Pseudomonas thivervalensis TaxID=86265 RepID=UPI003D658B98